MFLALWATDWAVMPTGGYKFVLTPTFFCPTASYSLYLNGFGNVVAAIGKCNARCGIMPMRGYDGAHTAVP